MELYSNESDDTPANTVCVDNYKATITPHMKNQDTVIRGTLFWRGLDCFLTKKRGQPLPLVGIYHGDLPIPGTPKTFMVMG